MPVLTARRRTTTNLAGTAFAVLCAFAYGLNPVLAKVAYQLQMSGWQILQSRFLFAAIGLLLVTPFVDRQVFHPGWQLIKNSALLALFILVPMNILYVFALQDIPASLMSLIIYIYPLMVLILNRVVLRLEIHRSQWIAVAFILLGCGAIFSDALSLSTGCLALILAFLAMSLYAAFLLGLHIIGQNRSSFSVTFYTLIFAAVIILCLQNPLRLVVLTPPQLLCGFIYGSVSTVLSTVFLVKAIHYLGSARTSIFCSVEPVFTLILAVFLLHESLPPERLSGIALLVSGIIFPDLTKLRSFFSAK